MQCQRAELSIGGPERSAFVTIRGLDALAGVQCVVRAHDSRSINGTERGKRRRDVRLQSRSFARWNQSQGHSPNSNGFLCRKTTDSPMILSKLEHLQPSPNEPPNDQTLRYKYRRVLLTHEKNCTIPWEIVQLLFVIFPAG